MPRPTRCAFVEDGRRCIRNAAPGTPLCRAHLTVAREARPPRGSFIDLATEVLGDVLGGRGYDRAKIARAAQAGIFETMGSDFAQYMPDLEQIDWKLPGSNPAASRQARPGRQAPPPPPAAVDEAAALLEARRVLGFGPRDVLTPTVLRARHRELAKRHHPDRPGGSLARMQAINAAVDLLTPTPGTR